MCPCRGFADCQFVLTPICKKTLYITIAMQDLEDLDAGHFEGARQPVGRGQVLRHLRNISVPEPRIECNDADLPENYSIWVKTFGCAHNMSDSEYMMGQLQDYGYRQASMAERCNF